MLNDFYDNDDDLFQESSSTAASAPVNPDIDSFLEQTKDYIDSKGNELNQFAIRAGMATTFYEVSNRFIFNVETLNRSIISSFNRLTKGAFEKDLFADVLEESILKRFAIQSFLDSILSEEGIPNIVVNSSRIKLDIDESYLKSYFGSMHKIMLHAINRNIDIYEKLCVQIDRVPMKAIVDRDFNVADMSLFTAHNYVVNSFNSIKESLGFNTY